MKPLIALFLSSLLLSVSMTVRAEKIKASDYTELTPDQFSALSHNKTIKGVFKGKYYAETYIAGEGGGKVSGYFDGTPYHGKWKNGKNNCILLEYDWEGKPTCWKLLGKEGKYVYGMYNKKGKKPRYLHFVEITDSD